MSWVERRKLAQAKEREYDRLRKAAERERARPQIQIHARALGEIQWGCPDCGNLHSGEAPNWRTGRVACLKCKREFMVGVWFGATGQVPPFGGRLMPVREGKVVNRLDELPRTAMPILARFAGTVQWHCPECRSWNGRGHYPDWSTGILSCWGCSLNVQATPLLYRPAPGLRKQLPYDWSPPRHEHVAHWFDRVYENVAAAKEARQSRGAPSSRPGGAGETEALPAGDGRALVGHL